MSLGPGGTPSAHRPLHSVTDVPAGPQHPQAPGIANSALARVLGSEWRKRIPAYTAAPRQMHRALGLAGADRTQKVAIGRPKTGIGARWHSIGVGYGTRAAPPGSRNFRGFDGHTAAPTQP
eukprot:gene12553-biopygen9496